MTHLSAQLYDNTTKDTHQKHPHNYELIAALCDDPSFMTLQQWTQNNPLTQRNSNNK